MLMISGSQVQISQCYPVLEREQDTPAVLPLGSPELLGHNALLIYLLCIDTQIYLEFFCNLLSGK